ncbi:MAG TPA: saccharopine dehydrogenase C-terminal domain-containing protein [Ktedonobacteraceae bacterium]|nr:saccharopine dehydrogenase C-terminal domain-containing protein [Ktedonobacteraceae bacterium]
MGFRYAVIGSGRQGTSAAYDLARFGDAEFILLADQAPGQAERAAARVNQLIGQQVAQAVQVEVEDEDAVVSMLTSNNVEVLISGVPYFYNLGLTRAALRARVSMCDFGGNTGQVRQQLAFDVEAKAAGITLIPDCGQVPGLGTSLCSYAMTLLDEPRDILLYDGGIPLHPRPPWNYILTFNIEGLTNEYFGTTLFLRDGKMFETPCFEEYELVEFPEPFGKLEAFTTAGGTSSMPWTYEGKLCTLQNKTLRWPGHYAQWKAFNDAGLISLDPVQVDGSSVIPRHMLHAVLEPQILARPGEQDMVIIRVIARGLKDGREQEAVVDLFDYYDESTGFTAMERTTGWHAAIMAGFMARKRTPTGGVPVELAVPGQVFVEEFRKRGFDLRVSYSH